MAQSGLRSRLSGTLPISIAIHLVALLAIFVVPLLANIVVPTVSVDLPEFVRLAPMPPPPPVTFFSRACPQRRALPREAEHRLGAGQNS